MTSVLVVGTGSVGKRHTRNLLQLGARVSVYRYRGARASLAESLPPEVTIVDSLRTGLSDGIDAVVISNRTDLHMEVALAAAQLGKHLYVEKPLSNTLVGTADLVEITHRLGLVVEVGLTLRAHPNLCWLKEFLASHEIGELLYSRALVGQYLPEWRPNIDHRGSYSAKRAWGGGVIFDLVHELDLVAWLLGDVTEVAALTAHNAALEIETEAVAQIGLRLQGGLLAQVHLDYVRPRYSRNLEIVGTRGILLWDYVCGIVELIKSDGVHQIVHRVPEGFERNDMFVTHMRHFLARVCGSDLLPVASLETGITSLRIALACHQSAESRMFVRPDQVQINYRVQ